MNNTADRSCEVQRWERQ